MRKISAFLFALFLGSAVLTAVFLDMASAFDYEHPEQLSPGDCRVHLPDGRPAIRSGRDCPRSQPITEDQHTVSEPFWNNVGGGAFKDSYRDPQGGSHTVVTGGIAGNGNSEIISATEIPLEPVDPGRPYSQAYGRHPKGRHYGRDDYNHSPDNAGFKNGYPVHPEIPVLPADQRIFQEINKNLYPGMKNKAMVP